MRRWGLSLLAGGAVLLLTACGDQAYDPHAQEESDLAWAQMRADAARLDTLKNAVLLFVVAVLVLALITVGVLLLLHVLDRAKALILVAPSAQGTFPVATWTVLANPDEAYQLAGGVQHVQLTAAAASRATPTHYTKQISYAPPVPPALPAGPDVPQLPAAPPPFTFSAGLLNQGWRPSPAGIYLATGADGQRLLLPPRDAMHGMMAGTTGGGKSNIFMMWIAQLLAARVHVVYLNPHAMQWDEEHRVDWRPINAALGERLIRDPEAIIAYLRWLCEEELPARKERAWRGEPIGPLLYTFVDEWPALIKHDKRAADYYAILVREGRKYGLYLVTATQDALVKTLGGSSGEREQFQVVYYVGGDKYTKAAILQIAQDAPEPDAVGRAYLKVGKAPAGLVTIPLMDNPALYTLLGWPGTPPPWGWDSPPPGGAYVGATIVDVPPPWDAADQRAVASDPPATPEPVADTADVARVATQTEPPSEGQKAAALWLQGYNWVAIVEQVRGVKSNEGGRFTKATNELQAAARAAMQEAGVSTPAEWEAA